MTIRAFTDRAVFRAFVEDVLVPVLRPGQVVVLDNLPAHKYPEVEQAVIAAGCRLLFLPRYSPEFNPIEQCWSKVKNHLRSQAACTLEVLQAAVAEAQPMITPENALGWFAHCGYEPTRKPL